MNQVAYTPQEVADLLNLRIEGVWRLIRTKKIPAFEVGRQKRIPSAWVDQQLKSAVEGSAPVAA